MAKETVIYIDKLIDKVIIEVNVSNKEDIDNLDSIIEEKMLRLVKSLNSIDLIENSKPKET